MALQRGISKDGVKQGNITHINFLGSQFIVTPNLADGGVTIELSGAATAVQTVTAGAGLSDSGTAQDPILDVEVGSGLTISGDTVVPVYGTATDTVCEGDDARLPTTDEKDALAGTGTPSAANPYVSDDDSRLTDSRPPNGSASGDLSGTYPAPVVAKIQARTVASTAPSNGQALIWNSGTAQWEPGGVPAGTGVLTVAAGEGLSDSGTASDPIIDINAGVGLEIDSADDLNVIFGTTTGTACEGDDSRLADDRTPTAHATSHESGGSDPITGDLDANARVDVKHNGVSVGLRRSVNFIEGNSSIQMVVTEDSDNEAIDVAISASSAVSGAYDANYYRNVGTIGGNTPWYMGGVQNAGATLTTLSCTASVMYAVPFFSTRGGIISDMAFFNTTNNNYQASLSIYEATSSSVLYPSALRKQSSTIAIGGTGSLVQTTFASAFTLTENKLYWLVYVADETATLVAVPASAAFPIYGFPGSAWSGGTAFVNSLTHAFTYSPSPLPSTFPTTTPAFVSSTFPAIGVKFSG